jgi:ubiquinone/menaquinone biosynthesis C-methylase UbiE
VTAQVWDDYAERQPIDVVSLAREPVQLMRLKVIARRAKGTVLDVGAADGYGASLIKQAGHEVDVIDVSATRVERAERVHGLPGHVGDATALPFEEGSFDTVVLGEILEHLDNPGAALTEACRVAKERVVVSLPLNGWGDPTHLWRISLDVCDDPTEVDPTKGKQIVLTFQRGECWPPDYWKNDDSWRTQMKEGI